MSTLDAIDRIGTVKRFPPAPVPSAEHVSPPVFSIAEFDGQPIPAREEIVEGIPSRTVALLSGDGGTGKSLLADQLAYAVVRNRPWLGLATLQTGPVLLLSAEDDRNELHRRFAAIVDAEGDTLSATQDLHVWPLVGEDALLAVMADKNRIEPTPLFEALEAKIEELRPVLVIIDTLADTFGGEENSRTHARQYVGMLRGLCTRHAVTVLLLSHPSLTGLSSGSGLSGSTAWNNSVRARMYLSRVTSKDGAEDDPDLRVLRTMKANYGPTGSEVRLRWQRGVFAPERTGDRFTAVATRQRAEDVFLDMLAAYTAQGRHVGASLARNYAPKVFADDKARCEGFTKQAFVDAMNRLFKRGAIANREDGPPSKRRQHIEIVHGGVEE